MGRVRKVRPSPSMAVAFLALFIAGAGTVEAARLITGKQIKNNSITSTDVRNGSLLRRDFRSGQLPRGPQGLPGASGRAGRDGFGQVTYRSGMAPGGAGNDSGTTFVQCTGGLVPVGGDAYAVDSSDKVVGGVVLADFFYPGTGTPNGWATTYENRPPGGDVIVEVICANASRTTVNSAPRKISGAVAAKPLP